jgi:nitroreductase
LAGKFKLGGLLFDIGNYEMEFAHDLDFPSPIYYEKERQESKMNETLQIIHNRRSIRAYKTEQITDAELQEIMDAAIMAPSAANLQKWHFTVIQNQDLLDRMVGDIVEAFKKTGNKQLIDRVSHPAYHTFFHAPTVIIISGEENYTYAPSDCAAAAENILIAAESLNIGSCWIASVLPLFASEKSEEYIRELGIPEDYKPMCSIALGYKADQNPSMPPRDRDVINYIK